MRVSQGERRGSSRSTRGTETVNTLALFLWIGMLLILSTVLCERGSE